ncbi:MAG: hypothetical protein K0S32_4621 [Bacteroidetes bacterium]|nr:hypothetical protein [Bacteroidota bacterium]
MQIINLLRLVQFPRFKSLAVRKQVIIPITTKSASQKGKDIKCVKRNMSRVIGNSKIIIFKTTSVFETIIPYVSTPTVIKPGMR